MKNIFYGVMLILSCTVSAQEEEFIKKVAEDACPCTAKISVEQKREKIIEEINSCIGSSTMMAQLTGIDFAAEAEKTIKKDKASSDTTSVTYTIIADKNFNEIQAYMFVNCAAVKHLMASNNDKLDKSLSRNKKAMAFYEEGQDYSIKEKYDMAIVSYNKAVKADPKFTFALDNLGISHRKMGNYKEAIKCYQKSLEIEPGGTMPLQNMAVAYEYLKDYKNASATYEQFIVAHPSDPEGFYGAARTYYILENYEKAVDYMFKAYLLYNDQKSPYVNDALTNIRQYYADLKEKNKLDIFLEAAKNNKIDLKD